MLCLNNLHPLLLTRRRVCCQLGTAVFMATKSLNVAALMPTDHDFKGQSQPHTADKLRLAKPQAQAFRNWLQLIVHQQLNRGPSLRWQQRDCAGLVRFASAEALRPHDNAWLKANGFWGKKLPPELNLSAGQLAELRHAWRRADGTQGAFVSALELVQNNTQAVGRDMAQLQVADLLLFDQGQAQHLMIWMGQYMAYHTGTVSPDDNGLRAYPLAQLMAWQDTRWQPHTDNPNFVGIFRLFFLEAS